MDERDVMERMDERDVMGWDGMGWDGGGGFLFI